MKNLFFGKDTGTPNIKVSIFDLRGLHVSHSNNNIAIVAFREQQEQSQGQGPGQDQDQQQQLQVETIRYALYQTPDISRFLAPLTTTLVAAYIGVPRWAIPITWSGNLPQLPVISEQSYTSWMGVDGGFSSSVYAAALAYHVKHKLDISIGNLKYGERGVSTAVLEQHPLRPFPATRTGPQGIDLLKLAKALSSDEQDDDIVAALVLAGLNALSFNLVFRKLKLSNIKSKESSKLLPAFRNSLARTLLYNVTLREVDFESSNLTGLGETIGNAWAMNGKNKRIESNQLIN